MKHTKIYLIAFIAFVFKAAVASQGFIDLDDKSVEYYTGPNVKYFKEYHPKQHEGFTSFPLRCCDPVPIDKMGKLSVFFASAIEGHQPLTGQGIVIPESGSVKQVLVVRGKSEINGHRVEVYFGYDPATFILKGRNRTKVYKAVLLALQVKDTRHVENRTVHLLTGAQYLTNSLIGQEIKPLLQNPKDWDWKSAVFLEHFQAMLPKRAGFYIAHQMICLSTPYWTQDENRLKGIQYRH